MTITIMTAATAADQVMDMALETAADIIEDAHTVTIIIIEMDADALSGITDLIEANIIDDLIMGMMNTMGTMTIDIRM